MEKKEVQLSEALWEKPTLDALNHSTWKVMSLQLQRQTPSQKLERKKPEFRRLHGNNNVSDQVQTLLYLLRGPKN